MRNSLLKIASVGILFSVAMSCRTSSIGSGSVPDLVIDRADTTTGVVLYSISASKNSLWYNTLEIFNVETKTKVSLTGFPYEMQERGDSVKIFYNALVLPAGEYRLYNWEMMHGNAKYLPKANFSIPFTVMSATVNYIGDYYGITPSGAAAASKQSGPYFLVSNRLQEDMELIKESFPGLPLEDLVTSLPDFKQNNSNHSRIFLKGVNMPE